MKTSIFVEHHGHKKSVKEIEDMFKELWKEKGGKIKELGQVELYIKPEEKTCYYVVVDTDEKGKFHF